MNDLRKLELKGTPLKLLRIKRGLTQTELARQLGVNKSFISLIELGKRKVPQSKKQKFLEIMNITAEELANFIQIIERGGNRE